MAKSKNKFWLGAVVGGILGILFAPRKGKETREKLSEDADKLKDAVDKAAKEGAEKYKEVKAKAEPVVEKVKKEAKPYVDSLKKGLDGEKEDLED